MRGMITTSPVFRCGMALALAFAFLSIAGSLGAQETEKSLPPTSVSDEPREGCNLRPYTGKIALKELQNYFAGAEDLRAGMTCRFRINPDLPVLVFHFPGNEDNTFGNIEIQEESGKVIQTIENETDPGMVMPAKAETVLRVVDANFDGYKDLQLLSNCGATGNCSYDFYLFDPAAGRFVHNGFLSNLTTPLFEASTKQVITSSNGSAWDWQKETYQYQGGKYTLIRKEVSTSDRERRVVHLRTYERKNGKLELIESSSTAME